MKLSDNEDRFIKIARGVTQKFIETYGADWNYIDQLDRMIADALATTILDAFTSRLNKEE